MFDSLPQGRKNDGLLLSIIKMKAKERKKLFSDSSVQISPLSTETIDLMEKQLICEIDKVNKLFSISIRGIAFVEFYNETNEINEAKFFDFLSKMDNEFFTKLMEISAGKLDFREKTVVLALLGVGFCASDFFLDLKNPSTAKVWQEVLIKCAEFLKVEGFISQDPSAIWIASGNEEKASAVMRRQRKLPLKISNLYKTPGKSRYYLDLFEDKMLSDNKVFFIYRSLFEKNLDYEQRKKIIAFMDSLHRDYSHMLFRMDVKPPEPKILYNLHKLIMDVDYGR